MTDEFASTEAATPQAQGNGSARRIRVLIADDHPIVREGLRKLLSLEDDIDVVGEAADGRETAGDG